MAERNKNTDFQQKVKDEQGRFQAFYYNNLELLDPANKFAGRPRKLTSLASTTDLTTGRINNALSLTDQFRIYSTMPLRSLYPGFYPTSLSSLVAMAYTGTYRIITVNTDALYIKVLLWGAGGENKETPGGAGAYVEGYLAVTGGEQLRIIVGSGGNRGKQQSDVDGGGGFGWGIGGGGRTAVQRFISGSWTDVVVAGGGGGGALSDPRIGRGGDATATGIAYAGRSGTLVKSRTTNSVGSAGGGGGTASPGLGTSAGQNGAKGIGGNAAAYGGGGGGGWYGGGGGAQSPPYHGAGGGGSSYGNLLDQFVGDDGNDGIAGNSGSSLRTNSAGDANSDGLLYYQYYKYLP